MPKAKGKPANARCSVFIYIFFTGKGGKNRRKGKNDSDADKRELVFKEFGQGIVLAHVFRAGANLLFRIRPNYKNAGQWPFGSSVF